MNDTDEIKQFDDFIERACNDFHATLITHVKGLIERDELGAPFISMNISAPQGPGEVLMNLDFLTNQTIEIACRVIEQAAYQLAKEHQVKPFVVHFVMQGGLGEVSTRDKSAEQVTAELQAQIDKYESEGPLETQAYFIATLGVTGYALFHAESFQSPLDGGAIFFDEYKDHDLNNKIVAVSASARDICEAVSEGVRRYVAEEYPDD